MNDEKIQVRVTSSGQLLEVVTDAAGRFALRDLPRGRGGYLERLTRELELEPIRNPVTGVESHPGVVLPRLGP